MHPDFSSEIDYLSRSNPNNRPKLYRKREMVGEIGWGVAAGCNTDLEAEFEDVFSAIPISYSALL